LRDDRDVETPQFTNRGLNILASGWNVAGVLSARSGVWLTVMTLRDIAANGILQQRVDQVLANPYGDKTLDNYLNPAAFAYPAPGQLGTHKRNSIEGPAYWSIERSSTCGRSTTSSPRRCCAMPPGRAGTPIVM